MYDCARMKSSSIFWILFFIFPRFNECEMQMSYANAMIGLTNALCNHCAPICYLQTLNYWPRCQFSMNANEMWCESRFFISSANASWRRCKCKFMMQMSYAGMKMQSLFMMMLARALKLWCKCLITKMEMWQCHAPTRKGRYVATVACPWVGPSFPGSIQGPARHVIS